MLRQLLLKLSNKKADKFVIVFHTPHQVLRYHFGEIGSQPIVPLKFTPDTGSAVTKNIQLNVVDQNETITIQPIKLKQNQKMNQLIFLMKL